MLKFSVGYPENKIMLKNENATLRRYLMDTKYSEYTKDFEEDEFCKK